MWKATDDSDSLKHYGVLGMRWGIRKDRGKALKKGLEQITKDQTKAQKNQARADKIRERVAGGPRGYANQRKAYRYANTAARLNYKATKQLARGDMEKSFKTKSLATKYSYKAQKASQRAAGNTESVLRYSMKAAKADAHSQQLANIIVQNYSKKEISKFPAENVQIGKDYILARMK